MATVSLFDRGSMTYSKDVDILDVVKMIKAGALDSEIEKLRLLPYVEYKKRKKSLPSVTWSGKFEGSHKAQSLVLHSGYICIDIDNVKNVKEVTNTINESKNTFFTFVSPSGQGIKSVIPVSPLPETPEEHREAYNRIREKYEDLIKLEIDRSGSDVSRLCFLSSDENSFLNAEALHILWNTPEFGDLSDALDYLDANDYDEWFLVGTALYNTFTYSRGLHYWRAWSRKSNKYEEGCCEEKWKTFEKRNDGNQIGSIYHLAEEAGWVRKNLEYDASQMIPNGESLTVILQNEGIEVRRNTRTSAIELKNRDANWMNQFGNPVSSHDSREEWWIAQDDFIDIDLRTQIENKYKISKNKPLIYSKDKWADSLLYVASKNPVDPFMSWLESLDNWDGKERLGSLWYYLGAEKTKLNEETAKRMLVGAVKRTYEPGSIHDWMPVLIGEQGSGKSSVVKALLPENQGWFSDAPSLLNSPKEQIEAIGSAVIVEYAEIAGTYKRDVNAIKSHLSRTVDRFRMAYRRNSETIPRKWVAIGTANDDGSGNVLPPDVTGSRRFVAIAVDGTEDVIEVIKYIQDEREQLWAEALALFRSDYPNTLEELTEFAQEVNSVFLPGNEVLRDHLTQLHSEGGIHGKSLIEIMKDSMLIFEGVYEYKNDSLARDVARVLTFMGYEKRRKSVNGIQSMRWWWKDPADEAKKRRIKKGKQMKEISKRLDI